MGEASQGRPYSLDDLATLLAPVSPEAFFANHLGRAPLHVRGNAAKLERLIAGGFGLSDMVRAIEEGANRRLPRFRLLAHRTAGFDSTYRDTAAPIEPAEVAAAMEAGANVQVVDFLDSRVMTMLARLKTQLGAAGEALLEATISPPGFGWPMHLDKSDVIFLQCVGRKQFVVGNERIACWPRGSVVFDESGVPASYEWCADETEHVRSFDPHTVTSVILEPGDMLYCPAGFIHGTKALDRTVTLGLVFEAASPLEIIRRHLETLLAPHVEWRYVPPRLPGAAPGELPEEIRAFFASRIEELKQVVTQLSPEALSYSFHKALAYPGEGVEVGLAPDVKLVRQIASDDMIRVGKQAPLTWTTSTDPDGTSCFHLFAGNTELTAKAEWVPFFSHLVTSDSFRAEQAMTWSDTDTPYSWSAVQQYLAVLLEHGVIAVDATRG